MGQMRHEAAYAMTVYMGRGALEGPALPPSPGSTSWDRGSPWSSLARSSKNNGSEVQNEFDLLRRQPRREPHEPLRRFVLGRFVLRQQEHLVQLKFKRIGELGYQREGRGPIALFEAVDRLRLDVNFLGKLRLG